MTRPERIPSRKLPTHQPYAQRRYGTMSRVTNSNASLGEEITNKTRMGHNTSAWMIDIIVKVQKMIRKVPG